MEEGRIDRLRDRLRREPGSIPLRLELAEALGRAGDLDGAVALFRQVIAVLLGGRAYQAAATACERLLAVAPDDSWALVLRDSLCVATTRRSAAGDRHIELPTGSAWPLTDAVHATASRPVASTAAPGMESGSPLAPPAADLPPGSDPLAPTPPFAGSFRDTLRALAPDGSSVEPQVSLLTRLPRPVLMQLARGVTQCRFAGGELVVREGDPGHACYIVLSGQVRVLKREGARLHGKLVEVARLGEGAIFGEFALLTDRRRHATVEAVSDVVLCEIPRSLLRDVVAAHPEVRPYLERFCRERLLATLLTTAPFFAPLPAERRADLLSRFAPRHVEVGEQIVREGEEGGGLYLIVLGTVEISRRLDGGRTVPLAILSEGEYFGEMSLLSGQTASASAVAIGSTELAVLPPTDFYTLLADLPVLWQTVRDEAERRQLQNHMIVTGVSGAV